MPQSARPPGGTAGVIVVAAGASTRMGGLDKVFADLGGIPVLAHSVSVFETSPDVSRIVLVLSESNLDRGMALIAEQGWTKVVKACPGGARRQDSVAAGMAHLGSSDWILIHDGARPFVSIDLVARGLSAARRWGAAVPVVPVKDTIKTVKAGMVVASLDRSSLAAVQTPQVFESAIIKEAYARCGDDVTDDATLVERLGRPVGVFEGSYTNIKITTPEDLAIARFLMERRDKDAASQ